MKIVIPVGSLHIGGGCKVLTETANALAARGHEVEVVIPKDQPVAYPLHCKVTKVPALEKEWIPYGDVLLPNFYTTFFPAYEAWPEHCVRFSLGYEPLWVPDPQTALETYKTGAPVISISRWLDQKICEVTGKHTEIVNPGIDLAIFHPDHPNRRVHYPRHKLIVYIARNPHSGYRLKGFEDFSGAVQKAYRLKPGTFTVHLICPDTPLHLPGVPHRIFKAQRQKEMAELYRTADLFVSTSWFEGYSIPPLEAMACGTPVVTTNCGGVLDYCSHLKNAFVVPPRDTTAIAGAILTVLGNHSLAQRLIANGLSTASEKTSAQFENQIVHTIERIYETQILPKRH